MNLALLTAAGQGTRMGQDIPKQFLHIHDKPVIIYTLERFQNSPLIDAIVLVTLEHWKDFIWTNARQFGITKLKWVVAGGETGQESIYNGLQVLRENCPADSVVMIHDGNRPMIDNDIISDSLSVFQQRGSAIAAIPCTEAVFKSSDGMISTESIPREELYRTQTPHTYTLADAVWAYDEAKKRGIKSTTAICTLMNMLGREIYFSKGSEKNIKLTTLDDIDIFKALLISERSGWMH